MSDRLVISCLCGSVKQTVVDVPGPAVQIELCHCAGCRHATGQLYSSFYQIETGDDVVKSHVSDPALKKFDIASSGAADTFQHAPGSLYFCATCGCHVFRTLAADRLGIATGTIISSESTDNSRGFASAAFGPHINTDSTLDGGVARYMGHIPPVTSSSFPPPIQNLETFIQGSCLCRGVQLRITPPSAASHAPQSGYSDMIIPFHTQDERIRNPEDEKWWLRCEDTKYMAGLCACRSCRLASGFELQSWAFIPRANILQRRPRELEWMPLDFERARDAGSTLVSYESSNGVLREFCGRCGATVFWHDRWRPELVDVSVGLLESVTGARAEGLLEWWMTRVSFAEDAILERDGAARDRAKELVDAVESNMVGLIKAPE